MRYRLLVDLDVISVLEVMPRHVRTRFLAHFGHLRSAPEQYSDYREYDQEGRLWR